MLLQLADGGETVDRVAGESADRLGDDEVDLLREVILGKGIRTHDLGAHFLQPLLAEAFGAAVPIRTAPVDGS